MQKKSITHAHLLFIFPSLKNVIIENFLKYNKKEMKNRVRKQQK